MALSHQGDGMLFGHQNDDTQPTQTAADTQTAGQTPGVNPLAVDPATGASLPTAPQPQPLDLDEPSVLNQPTAQDEGSSATTPTAPLIDTPVPLPPAATEPLPLESITVPAPADPEPADLPTPFTASEPATDPPAAGTGLSADDLLSLKQQALAQLSPLVSQLDQTPEEKFRTTMMMIQSTDNPTMIPDAYESAQAITDEKVRAQALLDVINEINYFTQKAAS